MSNFAASFAKSLINHFAAILGNFTKFSENNKREKEK